MLDVAAFAALVDHTLLKPEATATDVDRLCAQAAELSTYAVCVNGYWVPRATAALNATDVAVCAVVGFPLGAMATAPRAMEAAAAEADGATEIDMVANLGLVADADWAALTADIAAVRGAIDDHTVLKVILETAALDIGAIAPAARCAVDAGADFVKTSTGFHPAGGASTDAVAALRQAVGADIGVKASGGIRDLATVEAMLAAGASRLGLSATADIAAHLAAKTDSSD